MTICDDMDETMTIDPVCLRAVQRLCASALALVLDSRLGGRNARSSRDSSVEDCETPNE